MTEELTLLEEQLPAVENAETRHDAETGRPNEELGRPPPAEDPEEGHEWMCDTARYLPFGPYKVRIRVQPGPPPRLSYHFRRRGERPDALVR